MRYQDKGWEIEMSDLRNRTFSIWESRHIKELKLDYWMSFEFAHFAQDWKVHLCLHWKVARYCEWHWVEEVHILLRANQPRDLPARCFIILSNNVPPANLVGFEHVCCDVLQGWTSATGKGTVTMRTEWALRTRAPVNPTKYLRCVPMLNLMQLRSSFLDWYLYQPLEMIKRSFLIPLSLPGLVFAWFRRLWVGAGDSLHWWGGD